MTTCVRARIRPGATIMREQTTATPAPTPPPATPIAIYKALFPVADWLAQQTNTSCKNKWLRRTTPLTNRSHHATPQPPTKNTLTRLNTTPPTNRSHHSTPQPPTKNTPTRPNQNLIKNPNPTQPNPTQANPTRTKKTHPSARSTTCSSRSFLVRYLSALF